MLKRILLVVAVLLAGGIVLVAAGLTWAHLAIRRERAALPTAEAVMAGGAAAGDKPVRLSFINTASQAMPRAAVLDPGRDPRPNEPYVMSHPSFVLEWADGRLLLIDVGMTRDGAIAFGKPIERLGGGQPIQPLTPVAARLGDARRRVQGVIFTHLHTDHVGGITELCAGIDHPVRAFMTEAQDERPNYTTRPGRRLLREAPCVRPVRLAGAPPLPVPDFPGVFVIAAGGHTPGSQIVVAHLQTSEGARSYVFTGDTVNNIDGVSDDIPKPFLYRLLMVPEDETRQAELRGFLRALHDSHDLPLLVSHDQLHLEHSGVPAWSEVR